MPSLFFAATAGLKCFVFLHIRVRALKSLCDLRAERDDIRLIFDEVLRPRRGKGQQKGNKKHQVLYLLAAAAATAAAAAHT